MQLRKLKYWRSYLRDLKYWFLNGFIWRSNRLHIKAMKFGEYRDKDFMLFHANFQLLVDYVELECSHLSRYARALDHKKIGTRREMGLAHLDWEIGLKNDPWGLPDGQPNPQSDSAQQIKDLYLWYKDTYPNRPDPCDALFEKYPTLNRKDSEPDARGAITWLVADETVEEDYRKMSEAAWNQERQYEDEDTEKLIALVKIRHHLWT